jgi:hypothetical protein
MHLNMVVLRFLFVLFACCEEIPRKMWRINSTLKTATHGDAITYFIFFTHGQITTSFLYKSR